LLGDLPPADQPTTGPQQFQYDAQNTNVTGMSPPTDNSLRWRIRRDELESADSLLKDGPIRERLLNIVVGVRSPTKVSVIADLADCDTETARDYLEWFEEMGLVHRHDGRPVQYERNDAYFQWRRIDHIREEYAEQEIVELLADTLQQIENYKTEFDAEAPDNVSLVEASQDRPTEEVWEALSEWKTLQQRATLLDAARREHPAAGHEPRHIDA
jgi:predicted ArsR family transcriptional regulator